MNPRKPPPPEGSTEELSALIETLHQTEKHLHELTAGEVDTVTNRSGRTIMLRHAQDQLRHIEAAKQAAILNALPAQIALLDSQGIILSVNEAWQRFGHANAILGPGYGIGVNYLEVCNSVRGDDATQARQAAAGIRSVLDGTVKRFSLEHPCHSPTEQCWFLMTVTPMDADHLGVVVMHLDITERKAAESRVAYLNRVHAVLSGINALIVRVHDRDELFREACQVAVEAGGFHMAMISIVDRDAMKIVPVASAGMDEALVSAIKSDLSCGDLASNSIAARAIREKKPIVSNDLQNDPQILFGKKYAEAGVHSMIISPLIISDEAVGSLALYASERDFFHAEKLKLLAELAADIAFAIDHLDKQARLDYLAYYDVLTGLANRALFHERLGQSVASAREQAHKIALVLMDIERFKAINDTVGRAAGDILLKDVAARLSRYAVDAGRVGRIDADHFAIMVPEFQTEVELARLIEHQLGKIFDSHFRVGDSDLRVAARFGIALFPADGADADTLFRNAEAALKKAKASNERYLFYNQKMNARVAENLALENQLRQALEQNEFVLYYQPKVNLVSGKLTGAEALIRWNDPRTGLVPPDRFIPILEETGLIHEVGRWALRQAIDAYLRWHSAGLPAVRIAVNVSPMQLRHHGFIAEIEQAIGIAPHAAAGLELEITESLIMENIPLSISTLQAIRALGVSIAIDDFGTGFSSLGYLARLPVDTLKIDRSFVIDMTDGSDGLALVSSIINMAHALKLKVVAEGVETEEQSRLLRSLDCDEMQGFLFSKPVLGDIFEAKFLAAPTLKI